MSYKSIVLFGASNLGQAAFLLLKDRYQVVNYCDNDCNKWGSVMNGVEIIPPAKLAAMPDMHIIITSSYVSEISGQLKEMGIFNFSVFKFGFESFRDMDKERFDFRKVNLGKFLESLNNQIFIKDITLMAGGSGILDYAFLKAIMLKFGFKTYLEVGTWMGESIAAIAEVAEECYSVSLPDDNPGMIDYFGRVNHKANFSRYFSYKKANIIHYCEDSKTFNFSSIPRKVDLVFIDGDHSYEGIRSDTENIFKIIDTKSTMVVWHDFKDLRNNYIADTVHAIKESLPQGIFNKVFSIDNNMCGVFIPDQFMPEFDFTNDPDTIYSYGISISPVLNKIL